MGGLTKTGVDEDLEERANALLFDVTRKERSQSAKSDILTPWKTDERYRREHLVPVADPSQRLGVYGRAMNPERSDLNSRDGLAGLLPRPGRTRLGAEMVEQGRNPQKPGSRSCGGQHTSGSCVNQCADSRTWLR